VVLFSLWWEPVGFFFVEYFGVSMVFLWYLFGSGNHGGCFYPGFGPGHYDFSFFPVDLGVEVSQPWVPEYYSVFPKAGLVKACDMSLVSTLDGHFAVSFNSTCFIGCSINVGESNWLF